MKRFKIPSARLAALMLALATLLLTPAFAEGTLDVIKHVDGDNGALEVVTYVDGNNKVGLLGIIQDKKRVSFAGTAKDWARVVELLKSHADGNEGGSITETEGSNRCTLTVAAGPALKLTILDPKSGTVVFVVPSDQAAAVLEAVQKVDGFLNQ